MNFNFSRHFTERRIRADVNSGGVTLRWKVSECRVDTIRGGERRDIEQIGSGKTECSTSLGSSTDRSTDAIRVAEQSDGVADVT